MKRAGGEQAVFRGIPASQGFKAADFAVQGADDGLAVDFDVMLGKRLIEMFPHVALQFVETPHFFRIDGVMAGRILRDGFAGQGGILLECQVQGILVREFLEVADARFHLDIGIGDDLFHRMTGRFDAFFYIRVVCQYDEVVCPEAGQQATGKVFLEDGGNPLQAAVSLLAAERGIIETEIRDIEENGAGSQHVSRRPFLGELLPNRSIEHLHGRYGIICMFHDA